MAPFSSRDSGALGRDPWAWAAHLQRGAWRLPLPAVGPLASEPCLVGSCRAVAGLGTWLQPPGLCLRRGDRRRRLLSPVQ